MRVKLVVAGLFIVICSLIGAKLLILQEPVHQIRVGGTHVT